MTIDINKLNAIQTMPTLKSVDTDWIKWADSVIGHYGSDLGKQIFINTWQKRGSKAANTNAIRTHLKTKYDIVIDESVWDKIVDSGASIGDSISKALKVGKVTLIVVGGILLVGVSMAIYNNVKGGIRK